MDSRLSQSIGTDLRRIEVAAFVDSVLAVGTASVLGTGHLVSEQMALKMATQMQQQHAVMYAGSAASGQQRQQQGVAASPTVSTPGL